MIFKNRLGKRERSIIDYFRNKNEWDRTHRIPSWIRYESPWIITDYIFHQSTIYDRENEKYIKRVLKRLIQKGIIIKKRTMTGTGFEYALFPQISLNMEKLSDKAIEMDIPRRICYYWENSTNRG